MKCWGTQSQRASYEISYIGNQNETKWDMESEENPGDGGDAVAGIATLSLSCVEKIRL